VSSGSLGRHEVATRTTSPTLTRTSHTGEATHPNSPAKRVCVMKSVEILTAFALNYGTSSMISCVDCLVNSTDKRSVNC
jgi:hypothetical protein